MAEINFFSSSLYKKGSLIDFPLAPPEYSQWIVEDKLSHSNSQRNEEQVNAGQGTSHSIGTFLVYNNEKSIHAYLRVRMQVPLIGTEYAPAEERALQATQVEHEEVIAVKALHRYRRNPNITPTLFAISEGSQDDQGLVPGGYVTRFVFEKVKGIRLAEDHLLPTLEQPHTFFQKFNREERDHIREVFDGAYQNLRQMGWEPGEPWATNLIWDADSSRM